MTFLEELYVGWVRAVLHQNLTGCLGVGEAVLLPGARLTVAQYDQQQQPREALGGGAAESSARTRTGMHHQKLHLAAEDHTLLQSLGFDRRAGCFSRG